MTAPPLEPVPAERVAAEEAVAEDAVPEDAVIEVVAAPDFLKRKIVKGAGCDRETVARRAAEALGTLKCEYLERARADLTKLDQAIAEAGTADGEARREALEEAYRIAHTLKGQGATFGYDLMTGIAASLCGYLHSTEDLVGVQHRVVEIHAEAMRLVVGDALVGDGGAAGQALLQGLTAMVAKTARP